MNLRGFLKQSVAWEPNTGYDEWNTPTFSTATTLPARKEERQRMVRSPGGTEILATTRVLLVDEVEVGDMLDGEVVLARESIVDIGGNTLGYTVFL